MQVTVSKLAALAIAVAEVIAGFALEKLEYVGRSLTLDRLVYNIGVMIKAPAIARTIESLSRALRFNKISFTINVRDMQRVYIRKLAQTNAG